MDHADSGLDRNNLLRPGDVLYLRAPRARILSTDWAGVRSSRDYDKWKETGLTPLPGEKVQSPTIEESPVSLECRVKSVTPLGTHDMFIAEIVNVRADSRYLDPQTGAFSMEKAGLMAYSHGHYHSLGPVLGKFGFSVKKKQ